MEHSNFDLLLGEVLVREQSELRKALQAVGGEYSWYDYEHEKWNCIGGGPTIRADLGTGNVDLYVLDIAIKEDGGICLNCMETVTGRIFNFNWTFVTPGTLSRIIDFIPESNGITVVGDGELLILSKDELKKYSEYRLCC